MTAVWLPDCALLGGEDCDYARSLSARGLMTWLVFCVGVVERNHVIDGHAIADGDVVIGVASSGVHSNGFSLVRKICNLMLETKNQKILMEGTDRSIGDVLIEPTLIYTKAIRDVLSHYKVKNVVHGIAHITGGGPPRRISSGSRLKGWRLILMAKPGNVLLFLIGFKNLEK